MDTYHYKFNIEKIFSELSKGDHEGFYSHLDPKVILTDRGTHPWAGVCHGSHEVKTRAFEGIHQFLRTPINYKLLSTIIEGNKACVIMNAEATANNGKPYSNHYCFCIEMNKDKRICRIEVFCDTHAIHELIKANTAHKKTA
jgi:ketosteroid isomerase-like protein